MTFKISHFLIRNILLIFVIISTCLSISYADDRTPLFIKRADIDFSTGLRNDDLDWNKAGDIDGKNPTVLSELKWSDLEIWQLGLDSKFEISRNDYDSLGFFMGFKFDYGQIFNGKNTDSDYLGDNRTNQFSRITSNSDDGDVLDISLFFGPNLTFNNPRYSIVPLIGYSYHEQNLTLTDAYIETPPIGSYPGLDSRYETEWKGPWLGVFFESLIGETLKVSSQIEYHWADYSAVADWNLREDLQHPRSFDHQADGSGVLLDLNIDYLLFKNWQIGLQGTYQDWETDAGTERVYLRDGTVLCTRLNEVNWDSVSIGLKLIYSF